MSPKETYPARGGFAGQFNDDAEGIYLKDIAQHPLLNKDDEARLGKAVQEGIRAGEELERYRQQATGSGTADGVWPDPVNSPPETDRISADQSADITLEGLGKATGAKSKEERRLERQIRAGEIAKEQFINSNLRLVVSIAKKYKSSGLPLLDLIQEGNLGLMHAVEKFDYRKGFKFSTYATWWIKQSITRGIANTSRTMRLPNHSGDSLRAVKNASESYFSQHGREPTLEELAEETGLPKDKVKATQMAGIRTELKSLDEPVADGASANLGDRLASTDPPPEVSVMQSLLPQVVERMLSPLDEREREILRLRFGLDQGETRSLEEVGTHFNLTRERIRQIEARAMSKLRHPSVGIDSESLFGS